MLWFYLCIVLSFFFNLNHEYNNSVFSATFKTCYLLFLLFSSLWSCLLSYWLRLRLQWWGNCRQVHWHEIGLFWRDSCIQIHSSSVHFCINDSINCVWCCCGALQVYCTLRLYCLYNRYVTTLFIFFKGKNPPLTIQGNVVPSLFFKSLLLFKSYQRNAIFTKLSPRT